MWNLQVRFVPIMSFLSSRSKVFLPLALGTLVLTLILSARSWDRFTALRSDLSSSREIIENTERLLSALVDAETGQRGFLLTGQEEYLEPFLSGTKQAPLELESLRRAVRSIPEQRALVEAITPLLRTRFDQLHLSIELRTSKGFDAADYLVRTNVGKHLMDRIRALCAQIHSAEYSRLIAYRTAAEREEKESLAVGITGSLLLTLLLALATFAIRMAEQQKLQLIADLQHQREHLRRQALLLDLANDTIFIKDGKDRITYWNQGAERLYGWTKEEALGQVAQTLIHTRFPEPLECIMAKVLATGHWHGELVHTRRDGAQVAVTSGWTLHQGDPNQPAAIIEMNFDMTARKKAERELRNARDRLNAILNSCHDGIILYEAIRDEGGVVRDLRIAAVNPATEKLAGMQARDLIGHTLLETFPTAGTSGLIQRYTQVIEEGGVMDIEYLSPTGGLNRWFRIAAERLGDGLVVSHTEITERKRAEVELKTQAERLSLATKAFQAGIWDWDVRANRIIWDERLYEIYGLPPNSGIDYQTWASTVVPEDLPRVEAWLQRVLASKSQDSAEFRIILPDGSLRYVETVEGAILDDAGQIVRLVGVNLDITERKLEEQRLRELTAKLRAANGELEAFAHVASHDLKAPLRVIDNASQWLEEDLAEHLTDDTRGTLKLLRGRVKRMEKLLDDLLEYARIGRVTEGDQAEMISGDELTGNILALMDLGHFTVKVSPDFAGIRVRAMPLQQILMNLIGNAFKHHDRRNGCIEVTVEDRGDLYAFAVKDDGPGIPPRYHEQIFKMFTTLKPRDQVEGSGMGLAMVRKHVEVFGGKLELESAEGKGSTFRFTLPKQKPVRTMPVDSSPVSEAKQAGAAPDLAPCPQ
jgi:PAS domain S-box-containing protein